MYGFYGNKDDDDDDVSIKSSGRPAIPSLVSHFARTRVGI
jgi:hypothetical protein